MKGVFIGIFSILFIFNVIYIQMSPETTLDLYLGAMTGLVASSIAVGILGGIQVLGTGLNSESIKILFGTSTLLNALFSINIAGYPLGLGLATNVISVFDATEGVGLGFVIATGLSLLALVSGLIIIIGGD